MSPKEVSAWVPAAMMRYYEDGGFYPEASERQRERERERERERGNVCVSSLHRAWLVADIMIWSLTGAPVCTALHCTTLHYTGCSSQGGAGAFASNIVPIIEVGGGG